MEPRLAGRRFPGTRDGFARKGVTRGTAAAGLTWEIDAMTTDRASALPHGIIAAEAAAAARARASAAMGSAAPVPEELISELLRHEQYGSLVGLLMAGRIDPGGVVRQIRSEAWTAQARREAIATAAPPPRPMPAPVEG